MKKESEDRRQEPGVAKSTENFQSLSSQQYQNRGRIIVDLGANVVLGKVLLTPDS
jgi:hypothetical protein